MTFKSYIINLPREKSRRDFMKTQMGALDIDHILIPAVTVSDISYSDYIKEGMGWERPLRKTELACFLSHKKAWELAALSNTKSLILEDDALLSSSCKEVINDVIRCIDFDFICLETRFRRKKLIGPIQKSLKSLKINGGEGGIRTHERVAPLLVFKTSAFNRSATSPLKKLIY